MDIKASFDKEYWKQYRHVLINQPLKLHDNNNDDKCIA